MSATDAQLLTLARNGDRDSFTELVRTHQSMVRNQLRQLTRGDLALADDLAQETFIQAWSHLSGFRLEARFSTWLYRIAYNRFLMHARSRKNAPCLNSDDTQEYDAENTSQENTIPITRLDVERALMRLPEHERIALIHCYHLDLSHDEAADVLGIPIGTLKSHVLRGKTRLRELLAAWAPETQL